MPHILLDKDFVVDAPKYLQNGVSINFIASSEFEEKIGISTEDKRFLLTKKTTEDGILLKYDKHTRVSPVSIVKKAINEVADYSQRTILYSNTNINENKVEPQKEYLKDIEYFVNDFEYTKEIWIEIGFGSGRHIIHQAKLNPNVLLIGLEIHSPSIEQMLKQVKLENISNILAINYDARLFLEFIKSNSISRIFVHFPVPWPKKPHRRVFSEEFVNESIRVLAQNKTLELRTDDEDYFNYSKEITSTKDAIITTYVNKDLDITSKYETRWKAHQKDIFDLILQVNTISEEIDECYSFEFKSKIDVQKLLTNFKRETILGDGFFLHTETIYKIDDNSCLIKVSMGSYNKPEAKYIIIKDNKASYFQNNPIASKTNFKAHQKILELL